MKLRLNIFCSFICIIITNGIPRYAYSESTEELFNVSRIQLHTTIGPSQHGSLTSFEINDFVNSLGLTLYTRHLRTDWRRPAWIESSNASDESSSSNYSTIKQAVQKGNAGGLLVGGYYWEAGALAEELKPENYENLVGIKEGLSATRDKDYLPPEWLCRTPNGELIPARAGTKIRGYHADLTSDYRDQVLEDLETIADLGFSMLFFDERHFPRSDQSLCFGSKLEETFREQNAIETPAVSWDSLIVGRFAQYQAKAMADTFSYWKKQLESKNKDMFFVVSGTYLSTLVFPNMSPLLARSVDSVKVEYDHGNKKSLGVNSRVESELVPQNPHVSRFLSWIIARDFSNGAPPYIWKRNYQTTVDGVEQVLEVLFHGGIAAVHVADHMYSKLGRNARINKDTGLYIDTPEENLREILSLAEPISKKMAGSEPWSEVLVVLDELALMSEVSPTIRYQEIVHPVLAVVSQLYRAGVGFKVVTSAQISNIKSESKNIVLVGATASEIYEEVVEHFGNTKASGTKYVIAETGVERDLGNFLQKGKFDIKVTSNNLWVTISKSAKQSFLVGVLCGENQHRTRPKKQVQHRTIGISCSSGGTVSVKTQFDVAEVKVWDPFVNSVNRSRLEHMGKNVINVTNISNSLLLEIWPKTDSSQGN